ncbi:hypothetical protein TVAG_246010 [Trichomonas vaginalis G3]|uniref:Rab-GAP TBC domain-containing protein n=1 Tax=Trichomonas vaginalis (strain ATCC PRA-98 / G3) TaxID=412133 RepID=A2E4Q9_TRIV3|nr:regulation of vesicle fusion [Trichomonas vaginalis G3]EAY12369.1 hypothetical protein TVAG_246010 [Trichomonas vaginalis G3]KAI5500787.1 regulation of vesicle fusion [Trichomonas vaginalis G3]|eukprot:XP_001324592.1 hypothetical protein [Trichomonas vaginalis G3]
MNQSNVVQSNSHAQLSIVEPAVEIADKQPNKPGVLILSRIDDNYQLHWGPLDGNPAQRIAAVFRGQSSADFTTESWEFGKPLNVDCQKLNCLYLTENPLTITFQNQTEQKRTFKIKVSEFTSLAEFIERLIVNGIAVPSDERPFSLSFYRKCHKGVFFYSPPYIQLQFDQFSNLANFWTNVHEFFQRLIIHLDRSDTLPKDPLFPLGLAARAAHDRVYEQINVFIAEQPVYEQIDSKKWSEMFDEEGRAKNPEEFKNIIYHAGIDKDTLPKALPFVFGVYPLTSTEKEREIQHEKQKKEFDILVEEVNLLEQDQILANKKLNGAFRVISHDISRTDRQNIAFKEVTKPGLTMLTTLLQSYCIFNPPISYLQGMNDLFVPIILAYIPDWDDDGNPIDSEGKIIDHEKLMADIFWCFDAMLRNTNQLSFLASVTEQCQAQAIIVNKILTKVSPLAAIWMRRNNLHQLLWCYSDFVLLFKRSFEYIWTVWFQFNCSPDSIHWLTYFVAALIMETFPKLTQMKDVTIPTVMERFPVFMKDLDHHRLGLISLWLASQYKFEPQPPTPETETPKFDFFHPSWEQ